MHKQLEEGQVLWTTLSQGLPVFSIDDHGCFFAHSLTIRLLESVLMNEVKVKRGSSLTIINDNDDNYTTHSTHELQAQVRGS